MKYIPSSGKIFDQKEINNVIKAARDGWWTEGKYAREFEKKLGEYLGIKYIHLVNSGSSANLAAIAALSSETIGKKRLKKGDEFITSPVAFPTTVNPGILYGLVPVFVDVGKDSLNVDAKKLEKAITKKTRLIMMAHTLGMPFDLSEVLRLCKKYDLWLIEDCCDALGTAYRGRLAGTFGDIATFSFYPAHQITMGEGGAVTTGNPLISRSLKQVTNWGRDCWCDTGRDNTCGKRFGWKLGDLPEGYDHKYIFSAIGYNLKLTDFQAAIGCAQMDKFPSFLQKRNENFKKLSGVFSAFGKYFAFPKVKPHEDPSWFGFPVIVKKTSPFTRNSLTSYFEKHGIGTRNVFSGNLLRHPAYLKIRKRVLGSMTNADSIMENAFWIGVYPGISGDDIRRIEKTLQDFIMSST